MRPFFRVVELIAELSKQTYFSIGFQCRIAHVRQIRNRRSLPVHHPYLQPSKEYRSGLTLDDHQLINCLQEALCANNVANLPRQFGLRGHGKLQRLREPSGAFNEFRHVHPTRQCFGLHYLSPPEKVPDLCRRNYPDFRYPTTLFITMKGTYMKTTNFDLLRCLGINDRGRRYTGSPCPLYVSVD